MRARRPRAARSQRGAAVLVLLALLGIIVPMLLAASYRPPHPEEQARQRSLRALLTAREALLARAIKGRRDNFDSGAEPDYRPGSLPCPDVDNNGSADGSNCFAYLGRLPYKTLEIDDLRDGAGERLWYALSPAFRPAVYPLADARGQLRLKGSKEAIVAVLLAPGAALGVQSRGCDTAPLRCARLDPANFLESANGSGAAPGMVPGATAVYEMRSESGRTDATFNDLVLPITAGMFMPAVARRVTREALRCLWSVTHAQEGVPYADQPFPPARRWLPGTSPCGATGSHGYFEAWRPYLYHRRERDDRLIVSAGQTTACLSLRPEQPPC